MVVSTSTFPDADSRARWLFDFVGMELDAVSIEAWRRLRREAWGFVDDGDSVIEIDNAIGATGRPDPDVDPGALRDLQDEVRRGLQAVEDGRWWIVDGPTKLGIARWVGVVRKGHRVGGFRTLFLAIAVDIVKDYWPKIRACPQCRRWFLRHGKQTFCSSKCSQKTRWARFAPDRPKRDYQQERKRAVRKKLGPNVRTGRNRKLQR